MKNDAACEFIPLKEYARSPLSSKIRTNILGFSESSYAHSKITIQDVFSGIDWKPISNAFDYTMNQLPTKNLAQVCVGFFGSAGHILRTWASERNIELLEAPLIEQLLESNVETKLLPQDNKKTLVVPSLEKWFLRHHRGLKWIEQIIEIAWVQKRDLVIGCDLWAWKYLERALQIDAICQDPLINACLDSGQLRKWVFSMYEQKNIRFVIEGEDCFSENSKKSARFFDELVEKSQGSMSFALVLWQLLLLENSSESLDGVIELCPNRNLKVSNSLGALESRLNLYVLHVLLIHSGLPTALVLILLPFSGMQIKKALVELEAQGILIKNHEVWEVSPKRYFDVTQQLKNRGFWIADYSK